MKRKISSFLFGLLFLAGFGLLAYPTISNQWNTYRQSKLISNYDTVVSQMTEEDFEEAWAAARSYNQTFEQNSIRSDVFGISESDDMKSTEYWKVVIVLLNHGKNPVNLIRHIFIQNVQVEPVASV